MDKKVLIDENEFPTLDIIFSHLGRTKSYWIALFDYIHENHADFNEEWRYYKDGYAWLLKITRKKKTVCWINVLRKKFTLTFYFTDRVEPFLKDSKISDELKTQFKNAKYYNKIRGLTITFKNKKDVEYAKELIEIKLSVK